MADSVDVAITKAVVTQLAAASLSQTIDPVRSDAEWSRPLETDELQDNELHVDVVTVATGKKAAMQDRGSLLYTVPVDIAVRQRFGQDKRDVDNLGRVAIENIDALKFLVEEIFELFIPVSLDDYTQAVWLSTEILVCPIKAHLRDMKQFTGIVRLTFEASKAIA